MPSTVTHYTLVFLFNKDLSKVVLIHKTRPAWQKNKYNGVGGKIEAEESPRDAATREAQEETGYTVLSETLSAIGKLKAKEWVVHIFAAQIKESAQLHTETTEGTVEWHPTKNLPKNCIDNLYWLIPLAINYLQEKYITKSIIYYKSNTEHQ